MMCTMMFTHKTQNKMDDRQPKQRTRASGTESVCKSSMRREAVAVATLNKHSLEEQ
jgi:hypothetical protein